MISMLWDTKAYVPPKRLGLEDTPWIVYLQILAAILSIY